MAYFDGLAGVVQTVAHQDPHAGIRAAADRPGRIGLPLRGGECRVSCGGRVVADVGAHGGNHALDARVRLAEAPVRLAVAGGGFDDEGVQVRGYGVDAAGELIELSLRVAPKGAVGFAVAAAFFREACADVLDSFETFVDGHGLYPV